MRIQIKNVQHSFHGIRFVNKELIQEIIANNNEKYIARGHGCSFGDQAILKSGIVLSTNALKEIKL